MVGKAESSGPKDMLSRGNGTGLHLCEILTGGAARGQLRNPLALLNISVANTIYIYRRPSIRDFSALACRRRRT